LKKSRGKEKKKKKTSAGEREKKKTGGSSVAFNLISHLLIWEGKGSAAGPSCGGEAKKKGGGEILLGPILLRARGQWWGGILRFSGLKEDAWGEKGTHGGESTKRFLGARRRKF